MPPGPKSRISRSRRGKRRSHNGLKREPVGVCPTTHQFHRPHRAYKGDDGAYYYKGKAISPSKVVPEES